MKSPITSVASRRLKGREGRAIISRSSLGIVARRPSAATAVSLLADGPRRLPAVALRSPLDLLTHGPRLLTSDLAFGPSSPFEVLSNGNASLANFSMFTGPDRRVAFDFTDFAEAELAPFEWDMKRLATTVMAVAQARGWSDEEQFAIVTSLGREYRIATQRFAEETRLDVWFASVNLSAMLSELRHAFVDSTLSSHVDMLHEARGLDDRQAYERFATVDDVPRIITSGPHFAPLDASDLRREDLLHLYRSYAVTLEGAHAALAAQYSVADVARLSSPAGGTHYVALLCGRDRRDLCFVQISQASPAAITEVRALPTPVSEAARIVRAQRHLQVSTDVFLGWHVVPNESPARSFVVRHLPDRRATVDPTLLTPEHLAAYGRLCAWTIARAHARGGESALVAGYLGKSARFDEALATFAQTYLERVNEDLAVLRTARDEGRISVES